MPKRRLHDLVPDTAALDVARIAVDHMISLHMQLFSFDAPQLLPPEQTEIFRTVRRLAYYAVRGVPLDAPVHEYLVSLIPLYSAAVGEGTTNVDGMVEREPQTDLGLVIAGAVARERLDQGIDPLTSAQVAVLAGYDVDYIHALSGRGEIPEAYRVDGARGKEWRYFGPSFRAWLTERMRVSSLVLGAGVDIEEDNDMALAVETVHEVRAEKRDKK